MSNTKTFTRIFTIADYEEEENWLREQSRKGLHLQKMIQPFIYIFEVGKPEEMIYRLDYRNAKGDQDYAQMFADYGWECCGKCFGWIYFRKPASAVTCEEEGELFSDSESRLSMVQHVIQTRMLPLLVVFLCILIPQWTNVMNSPDEITLEVIFSILMLLYVILILHCGRKLYSLRKKLKNF